MAKTTNSDGSVTVDLLHPINGTDGELKQLTLKRLKGNQFRKVNLDKLDNGNELLNVIGMMSGQLTPVIDQLDGADILGDLRGTVMDFLGIGRATGGN